MTRALVHAAHGDLTAAWEYNWRWVLVAPLLVLLAFRWILVRPRAAGRGRAGEASTLPSPRSRESTS